VGRRLLFEARLIVCLEQIESGACFSNEAEYRAVVNESIPLLVRLHGTAGLHFIGPCFNFRRRLRMTMRKQPCADFFVGLGGFHGGFELLARYAFEREEHVIQRTIVMIFTQGSGCAGSALVYSATGDGKACDTVARAVRSFMSKVEVDDGGIHNIIGFLARFSAKGWLVVPG